MVRRNPAFRIAIGGLTVAVMLCLVGAISLLSSTRPTEATGETPRSATTAALQVASTGEVSHLLDEHPHKLVPEPLDHQAHTASASDPETLAPVHDHRPGPWTPRPEEDIPQYIELPPPPESDPAPRAVDSNSPADPAPAQLSNLEAELTTLKGRVSELARTHLESQLVEIRHQEQLLSAHQTQRMIEALQRDVDELKAQRIGVAPARGARAEPKEFELAPRESPPPAENPLEATQAQPALDQTPLASLHAADSAPALTIDTPRESANALFARVRYAPALDVAGRYNVDADDAPLQEVLTKLGPVAGWNLVCGPEMQGRVTCRWQGVDLKLALVQLLKVHGWQIREDGEFAIVEPLSRPASASGEEASTASETGEHATFPLSLDVTLERSAPHPSVNRSPGSAFTSESPLKTPASQPPFRTGFEPYRTEFRQIAHGSAGRASTRKGRIIMTDYPELMAPGTRPVSQKTESPQWVEIAATILEIRQPAGAPRSVLRQALPVTGPGPCPLCGVVHDGPVGQVGHSFRGWWELDDGIHGGVCPLTPELITAQFQQHSTTTVTATPRVKVLNRHLAEIALAEQPGFRRHIVRNEKTGAEAQPLPGGVQISLRPTRGENGSIRLELRPSSSTSTEFNTSLNVPPKSCVVLGGLHFERGPSSGPMGPANANDLYEVVILIHVRPLDNESLSPPEPQTPRPPSLAVPSSLLETPR